MNKVVKNKTDAINRFIRIVKSWHQEHLMKNDYLEFLRK
jgi:hypothetical protein